MFDSTTILSATLAIVGTAVGVGPPPVVEPGASRPSVVLFMADDVGFELFSTYGGESYDLPNLTALAESGMHFTRFYSQPVCSPSRVKIFTGKYNFRNYSQWGRLCPGEITFAHVMKKAGYATGVVGKWHSDGAGAGDGQTPVDAGFDEHLVFQYKTQDIRNRYWNPKLWLNDELLPTTNDDYGPALMSQFARDFITAHQDEPFLLYYPMVLAHYETDGQWKRTPDSEEGAEGIELFVDMIEYMDRIVGEIVEHLDTLGLLENTVVIFTSDNGTEGPVESQWNGRTVRGGKFRPTDLGTRVPCIVNWEGVTPDGSSSSDLVSLAHILPTLAEIADAPPPVTDGISFLPQIMGEPGPSSEVVYNWMNWRGFEEPHLPNWRWVTDGRWKLYRDNRLFDTQNDLLEVSPDYLGNQEIRQVLRELDAIEADIPSADIDADLDVDLDDLLLLLSKWGPCGSICWGNVDDDDFVGFSDLLILLSEWTTPEG